MKKSAKTALLLGVLVVAGTVGSALTTSWAAPQWSGQDAPRGGRMTQQEREEMREWMWEQKESGEWACPRLDEGAQPGSCRNSQQGQGNGRRGGRGACWRN